MIHQVFTVHDSKASAYLPPFYFSTLGQAIRAFTDSVNDPGHGFAKHPEDYTLFHLGTYDDAVAKYDLLVSGDPMGKALDFVAAPVPE